MTPAAIVAANPDKRIKMGGGESLAGYNKTLYKPLLARAGRPYPGRRGRGRAEQVGGSGSRWRRSAPSMPAATENWLAPAGEHPFELTGYYGNRIFDEVFKSTFGGRCEKGKRFNTFDARVCKP